tara:strand:- start:2007 stop:2198 length:192 start_codon:yes stop_codon:yes gene_type:complete
MTKNKIDEATNVASPRSRSRQNKNCKDSTNQSGTAQEKLIFNQLKIIGEFIADNIDDKPKKLN